MQMAKLMQRRHFLTYLSVGATLAWAGHWPVYAQEPHEDQAFFHLDMPDLHGETVSLAQYTGTPLVVNFWASWCPPCVEEMPELERLSQAYPEIQFLGLAIDTRRNIQKFLQEVAVSYDLLIPGYSGVEVMRALGNSKGGLPYTVLFDAQGAQVKHILGQIETESFSANLDALRAGTMSAAEP